MDPKLQELRNIVNRGYNDFIGHNAIGLPRVSAVIDANQAAEMQTIANEEARRQQGLVGSENRVMGRLGDVRATANRNTRRAVADTTRSIDQTLQSFGKTPYSIGVPGETDYSAMQPAIDQLKNRTAAGLEAQGQGINREVAFQERDTGMSYDDYQQRLAAWKKDKEKEAMLRYGAQRMAITREMAGADLERHQQLAAALIAAAGQLKGSLGNINQVASTIASSGGA